MDRETKFFGLIVLALVLGAVGLALYSAHIAFQLHSLGRHLSTQVIALFCAVFFVCLAAVPAWLAYLIFFRFLNGIELSGDGYALRTRAPQQEHATQLSVVRKVGATEGPTELTVIRADGKYWVCFSSTLAMLHAVRNGSFQATNLGI